MPELRADGSWTMMTAVLLLRRRCQSSVIHQFHHWKLWRSSQRHAKGIDSRCSSGSWHSRLCEFGCNAFQRREWHRIDEPMLQDPFKVRLAKCVASGMLDADEMMACWMQMR